MTQQGALQELQAWLDAAETRLEEHDDWTSCSDIDLSRILKDRRVKTATATFITAASVLRVTPSIPPSQLCQAQMSAHQATLDYVNQQLQTCSTEGGQRGPSYECNQLAEQQGRLHHQWLRLQAALPSQVREKTESHSTNGLFFITESVVMAMDLLTGELRSTRSD